MRSPEPPSLLPEPCTGLGSPPRLGFYKRPSCSVTPPERGVAGSTRASAQADTGVSGPSRLTILRTPW